MDASERWNFEDNTHNPEPSELGLCSPVFSFDNSIHNNTIGNSASFSLDGPLIDLEEGWSKPLINEEWHAPPVYHHHQQNQQHHPHHPHHHHHHHHHPHHQHNGQLHHNQHEHQHVNHSIYHEPVPSWAPYPVVQQHQQVVHQQIHPSFQQHQVNHTLHVKSEAMVSPFTLDAQVAESINNNFHHSVNQCDSDSERSDRSGHSGHSDRTTGLSSSSQSSYLEHSPVSSHSERELADVLNSGLTAADLRRPRVQRKRRLTSSSIAEAENLSLKPVAMMDEEEKRERNKQSASDYRKRRKNYVSDLENRLDAATSELSRKEEALRVALNEISSLKEQMSMFHSVTFKKEGQVSIPISTPADKFHQGHKQHGGIQGMSKGRRVAGGKGAVSIAMLTLLSCLLCQFGFFDTTMGGNDIGFASTVPAGMDGIADIAMSSYQAGAPDCSTGGCNKNRFLYWQNDVEVDEVVDLDDGVAHINAVIDESPLVDLDVDAAIAQMQSVVNATEVETDWLGEGSRSAMGYLDADSYMEDADRELSKSLNLDKTKFGKLDLSSMIASLFRWTSPGTA